MSTMSRLRLLTGIHRTCLMSIDKSRLVAPTLPKVCLNPETLKQFSTSGVVLSNHPMYFSKKHEWVSVDKDESVGTVGVTDYAQEALGDVVFVQLPEVGDKVVRGKECGALESVKAASELYSPVSGTVIDKNESVEKAPSFINLSAQADGWLFKVKILDIEELQDLMDDTAYKSYLKSQEEDGH